MVTLDIILKRLDEDDDEIEDDDDSAEEIEDETDEYESPDAESVEGEVWKESALVIIEYFN